MSRPRTRPNREDTKQQLFAAAASIFVRNGIAGSSVEDICTEAGLTRGAMYSNFANKDQLVLAMIDDHAERNLAELERLAELTPTTAEYLHSIESEERRRDGPLEASPVLRMEFLLYAMRNPANRPRLAEAQRRWREHIATIVRRDFDEIGAPPGLSVDDAAAMILALDDGYLLHELIEPGSYRSGTYSRNLLALRRMWEIAAAAG